MTQNKVVLEKGQIPHGFIALAPFSCSIRANEKTSGDFVFCVTCSIVQVTPVFFICSRNKWKMADLFLDVSVSYVKIIFLILLINLAYFY
jgi:hypothetical protein